MIIYHVEVPWSYLFDYQTALASVSDLKQRNVSVKTIKFAIH